jgi:hypothetical protein
MAQAAAATAAQDPTTTTTTVVVPQEALERAADAGEAIRWQLNELANGPNIFDVDALTAGIQTLQAALSIATSLQQLWPLVAGPAEQQAAPSTS